MIAEFGAAIFEAGLTIAVVAVLFGLAVTVTHWATTRGPLRRWVRDMSVDDLPPTRRPQESPVEVYLRKKKGEAGLRGEVER